MDRSLKESSSLMINNSNGARHNNGGSAAAPHRRGLSLSNDNNNTDLFSRNRRSFSLPSSDDPHDLSSAKLGRISTGTPKQVKNGLDDLLSSTDGGKHDYDWLLTPPGTPIFPSSDGKESPPMSVAPRNNSLIRSVPATKTSRLSVSQSERPTRSSSVTRPSISSTQYNSYSRNPSSILNTSSASVSSYIRPSTPTSRSSSAARSSTPSTRTTPSSRSSTPSRTRPSATTNSLDKTRTPQNSRPSTPNSRTQSSASLSSPTIRPASRPSTPTRRNLAPSLSPASGSSASVGRAIANGHNTAQSSRPSSPSARVRTPPQPIVPLDFPLDTPPNLRTTLPDRPLSAGRSRPGAVTVMGNSDTASPANLTKRQSSPIVTRGRLTEQNGRGRSPANGHVETLDSRKTPHVSEPSLRKPVKSSSLESSTGFGRSISKKSLDMAIKHMDIRNGGIRPLSGSTLFPQSIRSGNSKSQAGRASNASGSVDGGSIYGLSCENGNYNNRYLGNRAGDDKGVYSSKLTEVDIYESSRYDAMLLKEDMKNTSWLLGTDESSDQTLMFDNGFETLPEPFGPL